MEIYAAAKIRRGANIVDIAVICQRRPSNKDLNKGEFAAFGNSEGPLNRGIDLLTQPAKLNSVIEENPRFSDAFEGGRLWSGFPLPAPFS
jgi:hypothetical protein